MKKYIVFISAALLAGVASFGQIMQASLRVGSTANAVKIYIKPSVTQTPASISTLQFNIAIPAGVSPIPTASITANAFPGVTWIMNPPYVDPGTPGYINYNIYTSASPIQFNTTANTELMAMEVTFTGGPVSAQDVSLVTLPLGGDASTTQFALFYCTGTISSSCVAGLYYIDPNVAINNTLSYDDNFIVGIGTSYARFSTVVLPVTTTSFTAVKSGKDGLLSWTVQNQSTDVDHFELERSFNSNDFVKIATVAAGTGGGSSITYQYNDQNVAVAKSSGSIYYRVKTVDKNGRATYTAIRNISENESVFALSLYPNPARFSTDLNFDLKNASPVTITITDASGRQMSTTSMDGIAGNNLKRISVVNYAAGTYFVTLRSATEIQTISFVKSN